MLAGALAGMVGSWWSGSPAVGLACACLAALVLSVIFAVWVVTLDVDQVVAGAALNILAVGVTGVTYRALFGVTGSTLSVATFPPLTLGLAHPALAPLHQPAPVWIALALVPLVWAALVRTRTGLRLRAVGEAPEAAESLGIPVARLRFAAIAVGAVLAGAAGGVLSLAYSNTFVEGMSAGRGFIALAIVVFGRWHPLGVLGGALLFGGATAAQFQLQAAGVAIPYQLLLMLPYVLTLGVLVAAGRASGAPAALGVRRIGGRALD